VSNGNAERPTAQAPRGQSSANRVEVNADGRQGVPTANAQGQESRNGQSKDPRAEQLTTTRAAGAAAARNGGAGGARPAGSPSTPPIQQKAEAPSRPADTAESGFFAAEPTKAGSVTGDFAAAWAGAAGSATTATADRRPGRERFGSDSVSSAIAATPGSRCAASLRCSARLGSAATSRT
jgi:hypothetical protein